MMLFALARTEGGGAGEGRVGGGVMVKAVASKRTVAAAIPGADVFDAAIG